MKTYNIIFYLPSKEHRNTPYTGEKTPSRHDDFISHFPENVVFYLATHQDEYLGNDTFIPKYKRVGDIWEVGEYNNIQADLILGMTRRINCVKKYINPIREICIDKVQIEKIFPELTFSSIICNSYSDIKKNFNKISTDKKVFKPIAGSRAIGIIISEYLPTKSQLNGEYPYIIQEFIDTSSGFGEYKGVHDFRTVIINGEITGNFLRIAPEGILTANVSTGAKIIDYPLQSIPKDVINIIHKVDAYFASIFPNRYYSIDIGIGKSGEVKIFELNASPALSTPGIIKGLALHIIKNILKIS